MVYRAENNGQIIQGKLGETSQQGGKLRQRTFKCSLEIWFGNSDEPGSSHSLRVYSYSLVVRSYLGLCEVMLNIPEKGLGDRVP